MKPAAAWSEADRTVPFLKGRVALHALLRSAGVGEGDEVLVPGFTCVVVPAAVIYTGATPVFYDVGLDDFNGDIESARARRTERTRALIVQHTFGAITDPAPFQELAAAHDLYLIEDCAHAMGSRFDGTEAGRFGDGAFTSLQWSKTVTAGLGGIARFESDRLRDGFAEVASDYLEPAFTKQVALVGLEFARAAMSSPTLFWTAQDVYRAATRMGLVTGSSSPEELRIAREPEDYRRLFGRFRRGRLESALERLEPTLEARRRNARHAREGLASRGAPVQTIDPRAESIHLRVATLVENRAEVLQAARDRRIELGDWFDAPLHPSQAAQEAFGYSRGTCPRAEWLCERLVNLPTHSKVDARECDRTLALLDEVAHFSDAPHASSTTIPNSRSHHETDPT